MKTKDIKLIKESLSKGVITFTYTKKSGETRTAKGTTNISIIKSDPDFGGFRGGENKVANAGYTSYFDMEKKAWRCFAESALIEAEV